MVYFIYKNIEGRFEVPEGYKVEKNTKELNKKKEEEGFKKIKPETSITVDEARSLINDLFASIRES